MTEHQDSEMPARHRYPIEQAEPLRAGNLELNYQFVWMTALITIGVATMVILVVVNQKLFPLAILTAILLAGFFWFYVAKKYPKLGNVSRITWMYRYGRKQFRKKRLRYINKPKTGEVFRLSDVKRHPPPTNDR